MKDHKMRKKRLKKSYLNKLYYIYRRNNWMLNFTRYFRSYNSISIEKPIFLLGTQGGGLTLIARMLSKNNLVITVTGNSDYWAGADEMQNVYSPILPNTLTGIDNIGWRYASNKFIGNHRLDENDVSEADKKKFQKIIRWTVHQYKKKKEQNRFLDKSQLFTVKIRYINALCEDLNPKFLLISRNPYAMCLRALKHDAYKEIIRRSGRKKALATAAEHWNNSFKYALIDKERVTDFFHVKFEEILAHPEENLKKICSFCDLCYDSNMLPKESDRIPFGSSRLNRWYPIRKDVNKKYLKNILKEEVNIINRICGKTASKLGYFAA